MQDTIPKIIAAENEAKRIISEANQKKDRILREARDEAEELTMASRRDIREETERILMDAVQDAEQRKRESLEQLASDIEKQVRLDPAFVKEAVDTVVRRVRGEE